MCLLVNEDSEEDACELMPSVEENPEDAASLKRENSLRQTLSRRLVICSAQDLHQFQFHLIILFFLCGIFPRGVDTTDPPSSSPCSLHGK